MPALASQTLADPGAATGVPQALRPVEVTVVGSGFGADTTTSGAAGLWGPYKLSDTPEHLINRWGASTYDHLLQLAHSGLADVAGVSMVSVNSLFPSPQEPPFWRHIPLSFSLMDKRTLAGLSRSGSKLIWGYQWNSIVCEGSRYLPWLTDQIRALGGRLLRVSSRLASLEQLSCPEVLGTAAAADVDCVVNAAGLGSLELIPDPAVAPIRGQVVRVEAPWVKEAYFYEPYYIIPNRDTVVLGGTGQRGDFNLSVCPKDRQDILEGCCRLLPSLRSARPVADWVGLRPGRTSLRLEMQPEGGGGRGRAVPVVHNYGHGGAGLTLAWGCAGDVVRLIAEAGLLE
ncbi:hypothetical protein VOLCADRAFT_69505 [Volvox carteri f. nagariensis]|uniref:FAD dependent oxidoreductase domain-containing protein n=1 Tax=Volvox carteri f. nagariensis TaxID=3068 RepID=D8UIJ1_VOLCA|nr:uncharacterized protein VOLCADRAFT_69505 [Volvox carteri f. nagariensis]EFJ40484.1 hypothetical protein VOLCADRAFT_69505 [Volvox carteri f. nagariensis]|eukprot:XP_002958484.1 hypothetical protein VOLCADRAFT_69505 [Volvox carteri f. nagariensis]